MGISPLYSYTAFLKNEEILSESNTTDGNLDCSCLCNTLKRVFAREENAVLWKGTFDLQIREEARQEELRISWERQEMEPATWEDRLKNDRED